MTISFNYQPPFVSSKFNDRRMFGTILNNYGLLGEAVEIGTLRGDFAVALMEQWHGQHLHCIDPYTLNAEAWSNPMADCQYDVSRYGENREDKEIALQRLAIFGERVKFHFTTSRNAVLNFIDRSLSFVYIDGNHTSPYPEMDIKLWWPKVVPGGILAGHDIHHPFDQNFPWVEHIRPPVAEFAVKNKLYVHIIEQVWPGTEFQHIGSAWSWYIIKPKG